LLYKVLERPKEEFLTGKSWPNIIEVADKRENGNLFEILVLLPKSRKFNKVQGVKH